MPKEKVNILLFQKLLSYIELLVLNFDENGVKQSNFYEKNSVKKSVYSQDIFKNQNNNFEQNDENKEAEDFFDSIKESEERKLEDDNDYNNDYNNINNNYDNNYNNNYGNDNYNNKNLENKEPSTEGLDFLKETGQQRYQNALKNKQKPNFNFGKNNKKDNRFKPDIHSFKDYNNNNNINVNNNNNNKPIQTKKNQKFKPDIHSFKDYGEIDKQPSNNNNINNKKNLPANNNYSNKNKKKPETNYNTKNNNYINYKDIKCTDKI